MENLNYDASTSHLDIQSSISRSIGVCHQRDTISVLFQLDNPQNQIKTIENIVPACDCTSAYIDKDTIPPFGYALVNMIYVVDTVPGAFKKSADIFMHESDIPIQITICGYIK